MTQAASRAPAASAAGVRMRLRRGLVLVGLLPFAAFAVVFLLIPTALLVIRGLVGPSGRFSLANVSQLTAPQYIDAYRTSITLSAITAAGGGVAGFLLAWAVVSGGLPRRLRSVAFTFSGVAANFAGVPLAFAFASTLGPLGLLTVFMRNSLHYDPYTHGFTLFGFTGLAITYLYFQIPLMLLVVTPAITGLRREWPEAAASLGASPFTYWRRVAFPILRLPLLGGMLLLFGNSFGAYATAYALTTGLINLAPLLIGQEMTGNVVYNPGLGSALALGMVVVMSITFAFYALLRRRAARWGT